MAEAEVPRYGGPHTPKYTPVNISLVGQQKVGYSYPWLCLEYVADLLPIDVSSRTLGQARIAADSSGLPDSELVEVSYWRNNLVNSPQ